MIGKWQVYMRGFSAGKSEAVNARLSLLRH